MNRTNAERLAEIVAGNGGGFRRRTKEELAFVESVFTGCKALTFDSEEEWLEARKRFMCASDTPCILGVGFRSNVDVWKDKCRKSRKAKPVEAVEKIMEKGKRSEAHVREQFSVDFGVPVFDGTNILIVNVCKLDGRGQAYMAATLDAFYFNNKDEPVLLEIKRTESWKLFGEYPPVGYRAQVLKQMLVTGSQHATLVGRVVMFKADGSRFVKEVTYGFERSDPQVAFDIDCIERKELEFWNVNVLGNKCPDLIIADPE